MSRKPAARPQFARLIACALACLMLMTGLPATAEPIAPGAIEVIDGDTIMVQGHSRQTRLLGFDTPETGFGASCIAEFTLASKATQRLRQIVAGGGLDLRMVPCPCRPGTEGSMACNDGRACGVLAAKGQDVATLMIGEGLARPAHCGKACLRDRRSWC